MNSTRGGRKFRNLRESFSRNSSSLGGRGLNSRNQLHTGQQYARSAFPRSFCRAWIMGKLARGWRGVRSGELRKREKGGKIKSVISPGGKSRGPNSGTLPNGSELVSSWYSGYSVVLLTSALLALPLPVRPPPPRHPRWRSRAILERGHAEQRSTISSGAARLASYVTGAASLLLSRDRPFPIDPYRYPSPASVKWTR